MKLSVPFFLCGNTHSTKRLAFNRSVAVFYLNIYCRGAGRGVGSRLEAWIKNHKSELAIT